MKVSTEIARVKLAVYNAFLVLAAPVLLLKKAIKFGRRGHAHEWDLARWKAPQLRATAVEKRSDAAPDGAQNSSQIGSQNRESHDGETSDHERAARRADSLSSTAKNRSQRVVFVALSWGEVGVLHEISRCLEAENPALKIIWSIRDAAAQSMARAQFPAREIVPMPFDFAVPTRNWLAAVRPDALIIVEKFWWPNLIWGAKLRGASVILVNGRSRGREKTRYKWLSLFQKWVLSGFSLLLFESQSQIERVRGVLPRGAKVIATGNVKFSFEAPAPPPAADSLHRWLENRARDENGMPLPLLIAGSTAPVDEKWALDAFETVRKDFPCSLLLAPRRTSRGDEVAAQIAARGLSFSRRSASEIAALSNENAGPEVLLLDTLGELSYAYRGGAAAYVGGAVEGRGHNIIEPLAHGIAVSYGPNRGDFESAQRAAEAFEVGFRLHSSDELAQFFARFLADGTRRDEVKKRAAKLLQEQHGALDATVAALLPFCGAAPFKDGAASVLRAGSRENRALETGANRLSASAPNPSEIASDDTKATPGILPKTPTKTLSDLGDNEFRTPQTAASSAEAAAEISSGAAALALENRAPKTADSSPEERTR